MKGAALKGGDTRGPAIVPGKSAQSPLLQLVAGPVDGVQMPPKGERLTAAQVATLRGWIDEGAPWPEGVDTVVKDKADHWAFRPVTRPVLPAVQDAVWPRNAIDRFLRGKK